ncbi:aminodeoxychorismate synthase component I [Alistipes sp. OttesenSCG-928-B03]|nr:aminodeoxychorismate synthase component I [Alistipes sp. OttesenSCG-928-B03]
MRAEEVQRRMNDCGRMGTPFLFAVDFDMEEGIFIENPLNQTDVLFRTPAVEVTQKSAGLSTPAELSSAPITLQEYKARFDVIMQGLMRGDSYLANLTVRTPVQTNLSMEEIFRSSDSPYGLYVPGKFVCFSPERFIRIANGTISTNPMKGTISADIPHAEDTILADAKETAEHYTIVDLMRNDIGMVAGDVGVERFRYIDRIKTRSGDILQVSSEITGRLPDDNLSHLGDIVFRMLPAGSVSGAPKQSTVDLIHKAEPEARGYYTGVFGYFDGDALDTAVLIRFIALDGSDLYFHSGGGITVNSDLKSEYDEVLKKIYLPIV